MTGCLLFRFQLGRTAIKLDRWPAGCLKPPAGRFLRADGTDDMQASCRNFFLAAMAAKMIG